LKPILSTLALLLALAGVEARAETPRSGPPYPIILVHGFSGFARLGPLEYFYGVVDDLRASGERDLFAPSLPPYHSVIERGRLLAAYIDEVRVRTGAAKVHLIAHSQAGLDARYAIAGLGRADAVATLTTIASPHRGTPLADLLLHVPDPLLDLSGGTLSAILGALDDPAARPAAASGREGPWHHDLRASAESLSPEGVARFNARFPDSPDVAYFSVAAVSELERAEAICRRSRWGRLSRVDVLDPWLGFNAAVLSGGDPFNPIPNDGVVPTASMPWGELLGCVPADHLDQVGWIWDVFPGLVSGFDHRELFRRLVANVRAWERRDRA